MALARDDGAGVTRLFTAVLLGVAGTSTAWVEWPKRAGVDPFSTAVIFGVVDTSAAWIEVAPGTPDSTTLQEDALAAPAATAEHGRKRSLKLIRHP